jgi:hypothetical protein
MTQQDFYTKVYDNLTEGYPTVLISNDGFKMRVYFGYMDETGEPWFNAIGIEGSEFARVSETFNSEELERFVINNGFELYQ